MFETPYTETSTRELSGDRFNPTQIFLSPGSNTITGTTINTGATETPGVGFDRDFFTFRVQTGFRVSSIRLTSYSQTNGGGDSYFAIDNTSFFATLSNASGFVSSLLIDGAQLNLDLLEVPNYLGTPAQTINSLSAGTYSIWYQEATPPPTGGNTSYTFTIFLEDLLSSDTVNGNINANHLYGGGGNDTVSGQGGADTLEGGSGNDLVSSDTFFPTDFIGDLLMGDSGNDTLFGKNGQDTLDGGTGNDSLNGNSNNDTLYGQGGADTLIGAGGNDSLDSDTKSSIDTIGDLLAGVIGNDTLQGEAGDDILLGGAGNDSLIGDDDAGGFGNDSLLGGDGNDILFGEEGNDTLKGGLKNDRLLGGAGADNLKGKEGNDTLFGQGNNDTLNGGETGNDTLNGGGGNDNLFGITGDDFLNGSIGNDSILGGDGRDTLVGAQGNDTLNGGSGIDFLNGTLNSARGLGERDFMSGGVGNDRFILSNLTSTFYLDAGLGGISFARIQDFSFGDKIILEGTSSKYRLAVSSGSTFILFKEPGADDAVALIENTAGLNLNSNTFIYI